MKKMLPVIIGAILLNVTSYAGEDSNMYTYVNKVCNSNQVCAKMGLDAAKKVDLIYNSAAAKASILWTIFKYSNANIPYKNYPIPHRKDAVWVGLLKVIETRNFPGDLTTFQRNLLEIAKNNPGEFIDWKFSTKWGYGDNITYSGYDGFLALMEDLDQEFNKARSSVVFEMCGDCVFQDIMVMGYEVDKSAIFKSILGSVVCINPSIANTQYPELDCQKHSSEITPFLQL